MSVSDVLKECSEPLNKLLVPVATAAGNTLQDLWELVFGGLGNYVEKKRAVRAKALMEFKESLEREVSAIPEERLHEPALSVVGPALEASKYYFEEPELREMFAKLIAAAMDSEKVAMVHPSFTEIIKQLSPLDAQNLILFSGPLPVAELRRTQENGYNTLLCNVFLSNPNIDDIFLQAQSISSLQHLGLILVDYMQQLSSEGTYNDLDELGKEESLQTLLKNEKQKIEVAHGIAELTPLGEAFKAICLGQPSAE